MQNTKDNYRTYVTQRLLWVAVITLCFGSLKEVKKGFKEGYSRKRNVSVISGKSVSVENEKRVRLFDGCYLLKKVF